MEQPDLWTRLLSDPFVAFHIKQSHEQHGQTVGSPRIRTPRQVVGEQRVCALQIHYEEEERLRLGEGGEELAPVILAGVPFLWLNEIDKIAASLPIPRHIIGPDLFPFPTMWWTFEGSHGLTDAASGKTLGLVDAWVLKAHAGGWYSLTAVGTKGSDYSVLAKDWGVLVSSVFRAGSRWPDDIRDFDRPHVGRLLAMISFLNSPFIETARRHPEMGKKPPRGPRPSPEGVHFVTLRPAARAGVDHDGEQHGVAWRVRWIVRGHHRAQWYPSTKSHRLVWIAPYIKGPDTAPLKTPAYAVVR